ncbi:Hypothetical protein FKW44_003862 [Caligus rogercresseyi]|uniref:Uncharacterized protein n=1 Tax=Caligus rogercresseyi TaxID=217165 RepID=A0A7T8KMA8_CALRO|nr:Hypothetical protein FKW44_003862 [Caligus rogercresseyi]
MGCFWSYKSTANGPSVPPNTIRVLEGVTTHRQWAFGFRRTQLGVFWGYKPTANGPCTRVPPNTRAVFWGYKFPANEPSGSAKNHSGCFGVTNPPSQWAMGTAEHFAKMFNINDAAASIAH